jgi:hypothetical protein
VSTHPTGTHGTAHFPARRASDRPTPPPREGAAPCGGPSTPTPQWSLPNSSADALRAQAIEAARQANADRFQRILATLAVVLLCVLVIAAILRGWMPS